MKIREMREGDVNFILSTWLKSYYESLKHYGNKGCPHPKDDVFFQGHQKKIKQILESGSCLICHAPDEENQIIGWIVYNQDAVHYCYVKNVYRKLGIAKALKAKVSAPKKYSHHTKFSRYLNQGLQYDPYTF